MFRKFPLSCRIFPRCRSGKNLSQHVGQPGCSRVSRRADSFSGSRSDSGGRAGSCGAWFHTVCNHRAHVRFFSDATRAGFQYSMVAQETQPKIPLGSKRKQPPALRKENGRLLDVPPSGVKEAPGMLLRFRRVGLAYRFVYGAIGFGGQYNQENILHRVTRPKQVAARRYGMSCPKRPARSWKATPPMEYMTSKKA